MDGSQFLSTTAGTWLGGPYSNVWSLVGKKWIRKKAKDVNIGEQILYQKDYVQTTIEEVEPFLERSPRYAFARDELHEKNKKGIYIPKLRTLLLRGLLSDNENGQLLEERIQKNDDIDFSSKEIAEMVEKVSETIISHGYEAPSDITIKNWLEGNTVTPMRPKNWIYYNALKMINSEFNDFDINKREIGSKFHSDYLYTTVRQGIMRYLAVCKNKGKGPKSKEDEENKPNSKDDLYKTNLTPEIQATVDFFIKDISKDFVAARVTNARLVHKKGNIDYIKRNYPDITLSKGVVTEKPEVINIDEMSLQDLKDEDIVLKDCIERGIVEYADKKLFDNFECLKIKKESSVKDYVNRKNFKIYVRDRLIQKFDREYKRNEDIKIVYEIQQRALRRNGHSELAEILEKRSKKEDGIVEKIVVDLEKSVLKGEIDSYYNFRKGATYDLIESHIMLDKACPAVFKECNILSNRAVTIVINSRGLPDKEFKETLVEAESMLKKAEDLEKQADKDYPQFKSRGLLGGIIDVYKNIQLTQKNNISGFLKSPKEIVKEKDFQLFLKGPLGMPESLEKPEKSGEFAKYLKENNLDYFLPSDVREKSETKVYITREDAYKILKGYDLECFMPLIEDNFILEKNNKPKASLKTTIKNLKDNILKSIKKLRD